MPDPNDKQLELAALPVGPVLAIAPAGCGKTEALAMRARAAVERGDIVAPRKILAVTFSNKAKANLASRMSACVGTQWRSRIWVANLHGLAARVVKAHGDKVGIDREIILPEARWRQRKRRELGIDYRNGDQFEEALADAKNGPFDNDEVWDRLTGAGHPQALEYEVALRAEGRLDYDDLIRHAARLLAVDTVAELYRQHFGLVLVDEVQDLSMMQYGMVRAVGGDRVTYAGDPAQGIYRFAGADPANVFPAIEAQNPAVVELDVSYRSSPAVLGAVNALAAAMGATQLKCADPGGWPDTGQVVGFTHENPEAEAEALVAAVTEVLVAPNATVGVVYRRATRAASLRQVLTGAGLAFEDWGMATHQPATVALIKRRWPQASKMTGTDTDRAAELERLCRADLEVDDTDSLDELAGALEQLEQALVEGLTLDQAIESCRESAHPESAVAPGLHLLTGHKGKGQEFDWVFILGMEQGQIPDFRTEGPDELEEELRVLHVMASRARYGLGFTFCESVESGNRWRRQEPSPWLHLLQGAATEIRTG